ncbi:hypothetical protein SLEP1_g25888 [Rubroshorea leprosula]|uniref:Uncharacterized protein n=1 Tax=Rubroshorea leprosula TaxID=152421 RepID=A0AAV5JRJ2_9ROSI|nr:hypothetical protein SLEP1_g25888 [Rubroshorea leprosula]
MFHLFSIKKYPKFSNYEDYDNIGSYQVVIYPLDEVEGVNPLFFQIYELFFFNDIGSYQF